MAWYGNLLALNQLPGRSDRNYPTTATASHVHHVQRDSQRDKEAKGPLEKKGNSNSQELLFGEVLLKHLPRLIFPLSKPVF